MPNREFLSTKRLQIIKAKNSVLTIVIVALVVTIFSLFSAKSLLAQRSYQAKIIAAKKDALKQLKINNSEARKLVDSYTVFIGTSENVIGGNSAGTGDRDGDNGKIILDALPSKYDFPALATSIEKILNNKPYKVTGIEGTDDEINQTTALNSSNPEVVEIPISISVTGSAQDAYDFINVLYLSIRPIKITKITMTGTDTSLNIGVDATTYYLPQKLIQLSTKELK